MSSRPIGAWVAKVHATMLASGGNMDVSAMELVFGQPGGNRPAGRLIDSASTSGYFVRTERGRYRACTKVPKTFDGRASMFDGIGRFPSVWSLGDSHAQ